MLELLLLLSTQLWELQSVATSVLSCNPGSGKAAVPGRTSITVPVTAGAELRFIEQVLYNLGHAKVMKIAACIRWHSVDKSASVWRLLLSAGSSRSSCQGQTLQW